MKKYIYKIEQDTNPENPRNWDNITTMVCGHRRYNLGDKHRYRQEDYNSWEAMKKQIKKDYKVLLIKPLYMYDHSGITISTEPFSCQFDSGQIGWVFIQEDQLNYTCGKDFKRGKATLEKIMNSEVKNYDQYLTGEVYAYTIYEQEECSKGHLHEEQLEYCGGYYSEGDAIDEAQAMVEYYQNNKDHKDAVEQDNNRYEDAII
jgi:hypothetical protein